MSLLGFLKNSDKVMDAVVKGGDALILTGEEKIQYQQKATELYLEHMKLVSQQSTPTSISRRYVAFFVLAPFTFLTVGSAIFKAISAFVTDGKDISKLSDHWLDLASDQYGALALAVVVFYFGTHVVGKLKG